VKEDVENGIKIIDRVTVMKFGFFFLWNTVNAEW